MTEFFLDAAARTLVCNFSERMDSLNTESASRSVSEKIDEITKEEVSKKDLKIVFNLNNTEYVASAFLRLCLSIAKQISAGNFSIQNTNPEILKVFKIAGMDSFLGLD